MPDIAMCKGEGCPLKQQCYRYRAIPSDWRQSYFAEVPYIEGKCEYFRQIEKGDRLQEEENGI